MTDNGPQFVSEEYRKFTTDWDIEHVTSSPRHSQSNGKAESAVKIAKNLVKKAEMDNKDVHLTILDWRNTPNADGKSPVQMLMSRRTRTLLPMSQQNFARIHGFLPNASCKNLFNFMSLTSYVLIFLK